MDNNNNFPDIPPDLPVIEDNFDVPEAIDLLNIEGLLVPEQDPGHLPQLEPEQEVNIVKFV